MSNNKVKHTTGTIFMDKEIGKIYECYTINYKTGTCGGYEIFSGYGQGNPYKEFDMSKCEFKTID